MTLDVAARFTRETADHQMTVLHDDGLYRHLRFRSPKNSFYWFEMITVPGSLTFRGDGKSFVFARTEDMFEFFRGQRVSPGYWAEKLTCTGRNDGVRKYDRDIFERRVKEAFVEAVRSREAPVGLGRAVREQILDLNGIWTAGAWTEESAHQILRDFEFNGFRWYDTFEWDLQDYDWWFLWACHGIVWGIAQYDAWKAPLPEELFA